MTQRPIDKVLARVDFSEQRGDGSWMLRCPAHDDRRASLHLKETPDGVVLIKCYAGCDTDDVLAAMGLTTRDLFPPRETSGPGEPGGDVDTRIVSGTALAAGSSCQSPYNTPVASAIPLTPMASAIPLTPVASAIPLTACVGRSQGATGCASASSAHSHDNTPTKDHGRIVATWDYRDSQGTLIFQTQRREFADGSKSFLQRVPDGQGGWIYKTAGIVKPLYRQFEVALADPVLPVFIVEGERKVDYLEQWGLLATCSSGGAGKWQPHHSEVLRGRDLILLPDNDEPGRKHVAGIIASVQGLARSIKVLTLPNLPPKGDIVDWVDAGGTLTDFLAVVAAMPELPHDTTPLFPGKTGVVSCTTQLGEEDHCSNDMTGWQAFPLYLLPSPLSDYVEQKSAAMDVDPSQIALPLLAATGAAIGNTRRLHIHGDWFAPPILWTAIVNDSGSAKTPALNAATKCTTDKQKEAWKEYRTQLNDYRIKQSYYEKSLASWKRLQQTSDDPPAPPTEPVLRQYRVSDCTVEALAKDLAENPRGLLLARDELRAWFGGHDRYAAKGGSDEAAYLEMYNAGPIQVNRKTSGRLFVERAALCIAGTIQPGPLRRALGVQQRESGLQARFLFAYPARRVRELPFLETPIELDERVKAVFNSLWELDFDRTSAGFEMDEGPSPVNLELNTEAMQLFASNTLQMRREAHTLGADLHAAYSKLEEIPARLALIFHHIRLANGDRNVESAHVVDEASMQSAIDITAWFKNETRRVYSMLCHKSEGGPDWQSRQNEQPLLDWIRSRGGSVTVRDVVRYNVRKYPTTQEAESTLSRLVSLGKGYWQPIQNPNGGRPCTQFVIDE